MSHDKFSHIVGLDSKKIIKIINKKMLTDNLHNDIPTLEYNINAMKTEVDNGTFNTSNESSLKTDYPHLYKMILNSKGKDISPMLKQLLTKLRDLQQNKVTKFDCDVSVEKLVAKDHWNPDIPRPE